MSPPLTLAGLSEEEYAVVTWQYRLCGGFRAALWEAIARADEGNLARLARGFPAEVGGYLRYTRERGWWESVMAKAKGSTPEPITQPQLDESEPTTRRPSG